MVNLILAAALAAAPPQATAVPNADPAIFVVRDRDTTIYLFGTFHALDGQSDWFNGQVETAFNRSNELVLETVIPDAVARPVQPVRTFAGPAMSFTASASFLGTTRMAIDAGRAHGLNVRNGADMVLRRAAELSGKPVAGLETLESQFNMFNRLPSASTTTANAGGRAGDAAPGAEDSQAMQHLSAAMSEMQSAWNRGDQSIFVRMLDQLRQSSPVTYRLMFTDRNARWADWIAARLNSPGAVFVAVGAGHFAGKDSVLVRLAEMGIESERLN